MKADLLSLPGPHAELLVELELTRQQRDEAVKAQASAEARLRHFTASAQATWKQHEEQFAQAAAALRDLRELLGYMQEWHKAGTDKISFSTLFGDGTVGQCIDRLLQNTAGL